MGGAVTKTGLTNDFACCLILALRMALRTK